MIQYNKFPFAELQGKLPYPQKPSRNSCDRKLPFHFINTDFCIIFKSVSGSKSHICWKIWCSNLGRSNRTIYSPKHPDQLQHPPSLPSNEIQSFFSGSKVASAGSLTTHICLERSLQISGAIPPLNLSPSTAHIGTSSFYPNHLPLYISLNRSHPFWSYKGTFLYITFPLHSHYMTQLFYLHWSNYINIMTSFNNEPHYIIFCVLLLTSSTCQIYSW